MCSNRIWLGVALYAAITAVWCRPVAADTAALTPSASASVAQEGALTLGWEFLTTQEITVTSLGWFDYQGNGLLNAHEVGIYDTDTDRTLKVYATVGTGEAAPLMDGFRYVAVSPTTLAANHRYRVLGLSPGPDHWLCDRSTAYGVAAGIDANSLMGYYRYGDALTTDVQWSTYTYYAGPNFLIGQTGPVTSVPEASSLALMVGCLAPIGVAVRRRAR